MSSLSTVVMGFGAGLAHADPPLPALPSSPTPPPPPASTNAPAPQPSTLMPSATPTALAPPVASSGSPALPGREFMPPGHAGPLPEDAVVPVWAPPAPPPPYWAPWLPVVWNTELNAWGVWWNGNFQKLP